MRLLLIGEDREGALIRSFEDGLRRVGHEVTVVDPTPAFTARLDSRRLTSRLERKLRRQQVAGSFVEAVEQLRPTATLVIKGRGIDAPAIVRARRTSPVAVYYPDNPFWRSTDSAHALARLAEADLTLVWSDRIRDLLRRVCRRVATLPFGYDERWFPVTDPSSSRAGVAFVGTWHPRRERYLRALDGMATVVVGRGWERCRDLHAAPPAYGASAGALLQRASIGLNILHPHNAGAHNMRTRELAASGALQLTDPGTDGTPLRDGDGCRWFHSPDHLRELVECYLARPAEAQAIAKRAQELVGHDTYVLRARQLAELLNGSG